MCPVKIVDMSVRHLPRIHSIVTWKLSGAHLAQLRPDSRQLSSEVPPRIDARTVTVLDQISAHYTAVTLCDVNALMVMPAPASTFSRGGSRRRGLNRPAPGLN